MIKRQRYVKVVTVLHAIFKQHHLGAILVIFREVIFRLAKYVPGLDAIEARPFGCKILVPVKQGGIGRALYVYRGRELDHKWMLDKVLTPNDVILDLGANIGYYAILQSNILHKRCRIFAVEPDPKNIEILNKNIKYLDLADIISVESCAVSSYTGTAELLMCDESNLSRLQPEGSESAGEVLVKTNVYDFEKYLEKIPERVALVRMDIEGGEVRIFESLIHIVESGKNELLPKRIIFETHFYGSDEEVMKGHFTKLLSECYSVEFMSSNDEQAPSPVIQSYGYTAVVTMDDVTVHRGIYEDIKDSDAVALISKWKGTRTVCLKLNDNVLTG